MLNLFLGLVVAVAFQNQALARVHVGIYFTFGDSLFARFFRKQVIPTGKKFDEVDFTFVPFGKSQIFTNEKGIDVWCEYGKNDCDGNGLIACFIKYFYSQKDQLAWIKCMLDLKQVTEVIIDQCGTKIGLEARGGARLLAVKECWQDDAYISELVKMGKTTNETNTVLRHIPTLSFNNKIDEGLTVEALAGLPFAICRVEKIGKCIEYSKNPGQYIPILNDNVTDYYTDNSDDMERQIEDNKKTTSSSQSSLQPFVLSFAFITSKILCYSLSLQRV